ncbi:MAG: hypothetical protein LBK23_09890 [Oscillospiraceae bacterium]|nr:hypothetical protein [Oscillospiraceae bacterium]
MLSLFFIDEVAKYRAADGGKGIYAEMFEECYAELIAKEKYTPIRERFVFELSAIHNGYFSRDKKGNLKNTKGNTADDYDTCSTIMKDKEWLLSFDCHLRFIFSHSALKEGGDYGYRLLCKYRDKGESVSRLYRIAIHNNMYVAALLTLLTFFPLTSFAETRAKLPERTLFEKAFPIFALTADGFPAYVISI